MRTWVEATGLTNLLRNLRGSVGISALTTMVSRGEQTHQALMVGQTSQFNPVFNAQLAKMQTALTPAVGSVAAHYFNELRNKPVICRKGSDDGQSLKEGEIYYRYKGRGLTQARGACYL